MTRKFTSACLILVPLAVLATLNFLNSASSQRVGELQSSDALSQLAPASFRAVHLRVCQQNPYMAVLEEPVEVISSRMDTWLANLSSHHAKASGVDMQNHDYARFFPFQVMTTARDKSCIGGPCRKDASKIVYGLDQLKKLSSSTPSSTGDNSLCIVYSIGGNNMWEFENDLLAKTPCEIHTFDCTGDISRFTKPDHDRLHFHHVCLGTQHEDAIPPDNNQLCRGRAKCGETWTLLEMQQKLQHKRIDLFKIDIEGFEWPLLESWPELADQGSDQLVLPMQLLMEVHYRTHFGELLRPQRLTRKDDFRFSRDLVNLQAHLLRMGYIVVERDDNQACKHCTEVTLIRHRCPDTGAYVRLEA